MCGIVGWQSAPGRGIGKPVLENMAALIAHRGPDDRGEFHDTGGTFGVAHRRLSIIDLSAASHQPMVDRGTGVVLAYNGELYNFRALRAQLIGLGHSFVSEGDTEVVLRSFLQWGSGCFTHLAGMFALAIWDPRTGTLHLARDAMGIKPLYYFAQEGRIVFASELKAFLALPGFVPESDPRALQQYLEFGYVFDDSLTMLQGVRKLPPGHRMELRGGSVAAMASWFDVPKPVLGDGPAVADRSRELGDMLDQVVSEHMIADVPIGLLLSGGLDSSLIAALAAKGGNLQTVTMSFANSIVDERANARVVSRFIGSHHTEVVISAQQVKDEIQCGAWVFDDLFADWGTVTTRLLYRQCRERGLKVVLVGEGADELFAGYDVFNVPRRLGLWQQFRLYQRYAGRRHGALFGEFRRTLGEYVEASGGDSFQAVRLFESRRQLPNQYVMKVDKASMAESIEARAPYLDRRIAEIAYRTPREWLLRNGENKYLLRAVARAKGLLPAAASAREKFGAPLAAAWMDDDKEFRAFAREHLMARDSRTSQLGLVGAMRAYFDEGRSGYRFPARLSLFRSLAWRLLLLELWSAQYLRGAAAA